MVGHSMDMDNVILKALLGNGSSGKGEGQPLLPPELENVITPKREER